MFEIYNFYMTNLRHFINNHKLFRRDIKFKMIYFFSFVSSSLFDSGGKISRQKFFSIRDTEDLNYLE